MHLIADTGKNRNQGPFIFQVFPLDQPMVAGDGRADPQPVVVEDRLEANGDQVLMLNTLTVGLPDALPEILHLSGAVQGNHDVIRQVILDIELDQRFRMFRHESDGDHDYGNAVLAGAEQFVIDAHLHESGGIHCR